MIKIKAADLAKDTAIDSQLLTAQVISGGKSYVGWTLTALFSMDETPIEHRSDVANNNIWDNNTFAMNLNTYCNIMVCWICIEKTQTGQIFVGKIYGKPH